MGLLIDGVVQDDILRDVVPELARFDVVIEVVIVVVGLTIVVVLPFVVVVVVEVGLWDWV